MPSSTLMAAISVSIWARNSSASAALVDAGRNAAIQEPPPRPSGDRRCARSDGRDRSRSRHIAGRTRGACDGPRDSRPTRRCRNRSARRSAARFSRKPSNSGIDDRVGPVSGDDAAVPAGLAHGLVMLRADRAGSRSSRSPRCRSARTARGGGIPGCARPRRSGRNRRRHSSADSRSSKPNSVAKVWSSQVRVGVPRKR